MKTIIYLLIFSLGSLLNLNAQSDTVVVNIGKSKLFIIDSETETKISISDGVNETILFEVNESEADEAKRPSNLDIDVETDGKARVVIIDGNEEKTYIDLPEELESEELDELAELDIELEEDFNDDSAKKEKASKKKKGKKFKGHWSGFEFGFIGFLDPNNQLVNENEAYVNRPFRSWSFGLNLFQTSIPLIKNNFGIVAGLGFNWRYYHFANPYILTETAQGADFVAMSSAYDKIDRNRLSAFYLHAPLAFEMQLPIRNGKNTLFVMGGAYGNLRLTTKYKLEMVQDKVSTKEEIKSDFYLSDFEYGLTFRVGIDKINLYANYALNPLFRKTTAPEFTPITVGIMIIPFT